MRSRSAWILDITIIFFQGVSIKGLPGARIISLDTGKVTGTEILTLKVADVSAGGNDPAPHPEKLTLRYPCLRWER